MTPVFILAEIMMAIFVLNGVMSNRVLATMMLVKLVGISVLLLIRDAIRPLRKIGIAFIILSPVVGKRVTLIVRADKYVRPEIV